MISTSVEEEEGRKKGDSSRLILIYDGVGNKIFFFFRNEVSENGNDDEGGEVI